MAKDRPRGPENPPPEGTGRPEASEGGAAQDRGPNPREGPLAADRGDDAPGAHDEAHDSIRNREGFGPENVKALWETERRRFEESAGGTSQEFSLSGERGDFRVLPDGSVTGTTSFRGADGEAVAQGEWRACLEPGIANEDGTTSRGATVSGVFDMTVDDPNEGTGGFQCVYKAEIPGWAPDLAPRANRVAAPLLSRLPRLSLPGFVGEVLPTHDMSEQAFVVRGTGRGDFADVDVGSIQVTGRTDLVNTATGEMTVLLHRRPEQDVGSS